MTTGRQAGAEISTDPVRAFVRSRLQALRFDMKTASILMGRNQAYLQQFLNYMTPRKLPAEAREKLAGVLRCSPADLAGDAPPGQEQQPPAAGGEVPLISWVQAGLWSGIVDNGFPGWAEEWIPTGVKPRAHTFALTVSGDSMEPRFPEGTVIVVEPDLAPSPGDFVIARRRQHQEATFKQLVMKRRRFWLRPLNPRYQDLPCDEDTEICGVVREAIFRQRLR